MKFAKHMEMNMCDEPNIRC